MQRNATVAHKGQPFSAETCTFSVQTRCYSMEIKLRGILPLFCHRKPFLRTNMQLLRGNTHLLRGIFVGYKQVKASQSKAKQSKAKQSKAKQSKAKQSKAKQSKAKQDKAKQFKAKLVLGVLIKVDGSVNESMILKLRIPFDDLLPRRALFPPPLIGPPPPGEKPT